MKPELVTLISTFPISSTHPQASSFSLLSYLGAGEGHLSLKKQWVKRVKVGGWRSSAVLRLGWKSKLEKVLWAVVHIVYSRLALRTSSVCRLSLGDYKLLWNIYRMQSVVCWRGQRWPPFNLHKEQLSRHSPFHAGKWDRNLRLCCGVHRIW